jgi:hypothetical protein
MQNVIHQPWRLGAAVLVSGIMARAALAQQQYKILTAEEFLVLDTSDNISSVKVFDPASSVVVAAASATQVTSGWWDVVFTTPVFVLANPARSYIVTYNATSSGKTAPAAPLSVSVSPKLSVSITSFGTFIRAYLLSANVAMKVGDQYILDRVIGCGGDPEFKNVTFMDKTHSKKLPGKWLEHLGTIDEARTHAGKLGSIYVCLDYSLLWRQQSFPVDPASASALFPGVQFDLGGGDSAPLQFADAAAFSPQAAPASKDAAVFYANLQVAAGTGVRGAWGLDGKIALLDVPFLRGSWTLLSATANTGNNTSNISGTTYTDTIDWMLPGSWALSICKKAPTTLTLTASPKFETDYKFDKKNFLFSGDSVWTPRAFYQPQSYRSKAKNGVLPKYGDDGYARFGYELEGHAGVESGGALIATTAQNTKKTVSIVVPAYQIERVVPQIHGLFQRSIGNIWIIPDLGLLSFDSVLTSRYLFESENTVRQTASGALSIKQVSGWKAINTLTCTWNPPKNNNVGLTVTYKDGFDAPKFSRVNSVLVGVLIEF